MIEFRYEPDEHNTYYQVRHWITYTTDAGALEDLVKEFASFLRGAGYQFDGAIEVVPDEDEQDEV